MKKFTMLLAAGLVAMTANATDVYLIGGFNNWTTGDPNCKFTEVSETEYVLDYVGNLTSGFKLNDGTWTNDAAKWGSNGETLVLGQAYQCGVGGTTGNINLSDAVENPHIVFNPQTAVLTISDAVADVTFTFDPESMYITVSGEGQSPDPVVEYPEHIWVIGSFTEWELNNAVEMRNLGEGKYSVTIEGPFIGYELMFHFLSALNWDQEFSYGADFAGNLQVSLYEEGGTGGEWTGDVVVGNTGSWWFDSKEMGDNKLVINLDLATLKVQFGTDKVVEPIVGIETVNAVAGEVIYFNLQGARVANPENGLYIRIENGNAQKVLVK